MATSNSYSPRAVVLLSGGLDSATCLAIARADGFECHALTIAYGQRHAVELAAAQRVAQSLAVASHKVIHIDLRAFGGSALTDDIPVPKSDEAWGGVSSSSGSVTGVSGLGKTGGSGRNSPNPEPRVPNASSDIPITYVPARNTIFLAYALGLAEVLRASAIYVGVNAVDYSGYPDCRPEFVHAFQHMADLATKAGVEGRGPKIVAPLIALTKTDIIRQGLQLGVNYALTHSCYDPDSSGKPCGQCDSCRIRAAAFAELGMSDPAL